MKDPDKNILYPDEALSSAALTSASYGLCNYLPDRPMRFAGFVASPTTEHQKIITSIQQGYRRSGLFLYHTLCPNCEACIPVRIAVNDFKPNKTQSRTFKRGKSRFSIKMIKPHFTPQHFDLYTRYLAAKHPNSEMTQTNDILHYHQFILQSPIRTHLFEFVDTLDTKNSIRIVSVMDDVEDGFSAVYTFYDPSFPADSLGTFSILWQIEVTKSLHRDYLYLGYYIADCPQMAYKKRFSGLEALVDGQWQKAEDVLD